MKKLLVAVAVLGLVCAASLPALKVDDSTNAPSSSSGIVTDKKAFRKEMLAKYDLNHDGKLDKSEKAKMTPEDLEKWNKLFGHHKKTDTGSDTSTNAPASK